MDDSKILVIEVLESDLFDMVTAVMVRAERFIEMKAPKVLIERAIDRAEKYNEILKRSGYNYWTDEKFKYLKEKAQYESIQ